MDCRRRSWIDEKHVAWKEAGSMKEFSVNLK